MQQIFNFLFNNSLRLLFMLLLATSLFLTIQSHSYHKSQVINSANVVTGSVYEKMNTVNEYLKLKDKNKELALENAILRNIIFSKKDSVTTLKLDSLKRIKSNVVLAKVIHNSFNVHDNYLTIDAGTEQEIMPDMGVINSSGVVGIVNNTSKNYATVISILNTKSRINAKLKKSNHFGSLIWNGKSTGFVQLIDVPRLANIKKGDTIVTGGQSVIFPENINIGTISKIYIDNQTNYYTLDIKLFNDMTNLGYVYIIKNKNSQEIKNLEHSEQNEQ